MVAPLEGVLTRKMGAPGKYVFSFNPGDVLKVPRKARSRTTCLRALFSTPPFPSLFASGRLRLPPSPHRWSWLGCAPRAVVEPMWGVLPLDFMHDLRELHTFGILFGVPENPYIPSLDFADFCEIKKKAISFRAPYDCA